MTGKLQPLIVLVEPQLGANIGMCARAMLNCGLERLRLVNPREGWPNESAKATAADADIVLERTRVFSSVADAVADCHRVMASTARDRAGELPVLLPDEASSEIWKATAAGQRIAILFGPEASGLDNDSMSVADSLLRFPTNPDFASLNLAQAVLLFGWEWRRNADVEYESSPRKTATKGELDAFLTRLEGQLSNSGFFLTPELRPNTVRSIRELFSRAQPSEREVNLLHGILTSLTRQSSEVTSENEG